MNVINDIYEVIMSTRNGESVIKIRAASIPDAYRKAGDYLEFKDIVHPEITCVKKSLLEIVDL
jgi:septum formation inhibitor-activating ATPase MinD